MSEITVQDIEAATQVVVELTNQSEGLTFEQALAFKNAATELKKAVGDLISLLGTRQLETLDGQPKVVAGTVYAKVETGKYRPNALKLKMRIFGHVTKTADGEKRRVTIANAVDETIDLMFALYVSPSALPKQGGLKLMGMQNSDFCDWEKTGFELKEMSLGETHE